MISATTGNETTPAIDEHPPTIGPNLAGNQELCAAITKFITWEYWWRYYLMQQPLWNAARAIDNAWRCRWATQDLNITAVTSQTAKVATPITQDGKSSKGQNTMPFQQIKAVTDLGETLSFEDGLPMRAEVPDWIDEDRWYCPTKESAAALNAIIRQNAEEEGFRDKYRKAFGSFAKYGYGWVHAPFDLRRSQEPRLIPYSGAIASPQQAQMEADAILAANAGKPAQVGPQGVTIMEDQIEIRTRFIPLHVFDVYVDPFLPCENIERQPCPMVREFVTPADLESNPYDPNENPFGYLNIEQAVKADKGHYCLNDQDMVPMRERLQNRYNITDQVAGFNADRMHKRWTAYPLLRITDKGKLDQGDGAECPQCDGAGTMPTMAVDPVSGEPVPGEQVQCPTCQGTKLVRPPAKRYVVNFFGDLTLQTTCLRVQEMPVGMEIPLLFGADLVEDDALSIPMSKSEIMLIACEQVSRAETQFEVAKENTINRGFVVYEESPAYKFQNFFFPNARIPVGAGGKNEVSRLEQSTYDETLTLQPYIDYKTRQIQNIYGATDTLLGQIAQGRRSALEIGEATDAAKNPLVIMVDRFNHQVPGKWAKTIQRNMELWGDRDYIRRKTGRTYFGACQIFTAVGKEFVKKMAVAATMREVLQVSAGDPVIEPVRADLYNEYFALTGIKVRVPDMGYRKAVTDGMNIVNKILAQGIEDPPLMSDPHEVFVGVFEGALKDPYWQQNYPENIPLLFQRLLAQQQMLAAQQAAQQAQMMAMQQAQNGGKAPGKKGKDAPQDHGQENQANQGSQGAAK